MKGIEVGRKVLVHAGPASSGGAGLTRVRELAEHLPALAPSWSFEFVVRQDLEPELEHMDCRLVLLPMPRAANRVPVRLLWERTAMRGLCQVRAPDVVFSPFNVAPPRWVVRAVPVVVMVSNLAPFSREVLARCTPSERRRNRLLRHLTIRSVKRASRVLILSRQALDLIPAQGLSEKSELVVQSPPDSKQAVRPPWAPNQSYIVVVADLYKFKGIETVIQALPLMNEPMSLVICGRTLEPDYRQLLGRLIARFDLSDRVRFAGSVPRSHVLGLMAGAHAAIAPSRFENLSRIPSEAMAVGAPLVATDIPANREACGDAALYYKVDDFAALARAVDRLHDREIRTELLEMAGSRIVGLGADSGPEQILSALLEVTR